MRNLTINGERLWASLMELARIGATAKGGVCRLAASDLDGEARRLFIRWCEEAGCTVAVDQIGNIFARRPGRDPALPPVMTGSHLDTQPTGGRFDGAYGVMAGLELVRTLNDLGYETEAPVEIACREPAHPAFRGGADPRQFHQARPQPLAVDRQIAHRNLSRA